ncbi:hypothetical protein [Tessaracoccus massiliensis]|uniref:hypothetical protein n=1 Tax=Tessaracoccus massiliensis TaxID=1522311 RepID=UPI00058F5E63|nr:hypothetical protein [Tessaracoccus massiliensis]
MKKLVLAVLAGLITTTLAVVGPPAAHADVDIYITPGQHTVGGRQWRTSCEPYSQAQRCRTEIWATQIVKSGGRWVQTNGWVFNNLTYTPSPRSVWSSNPLGAYGRVGGTVSWTDASGRGWRTECDNASTGRNGCRTYAQATVVSAVGGRYVQSTQWVLNNMVRFGPAAEPVEVAAPAPQPGPVQPSPLPPPAPQPGPTTPVPQPKPTTPPPLPPPALPQLPRL